MSGRRVVLPGVDDTRALGPRARAAAARRRPRRAHRRPRRGQDHADPGHRRRARRARAGHLADLRHRPGAPVARRRARRWCTSTPTGSAARSSSTTSTSTPRSTTASPSSSGATAWPRTSARTASRSCSTSTPRPRCARRPVTGIGGRWSGERRGCRAGRPGRCAVLILALDTSTSAIGVAVLRDGVASPRGRRGGRRRARTPSSSRRSSATPSPPAGATPGDLTGIAVGTGPGPFTGLRVGLVTGAHAGPRARHPGARRVQPRRARRAGAGASRRRRRRGARRHRRAAQGGLLGARTTGATTAPWPLTEPAVDRPAELPDAVRALPTVGRGPLLYPDLFPHALGQPLDVDPRLARAGGAAPAGGR